MTIQFNVNPRWILGVLLSIIAGLTVADMGIHVLRFQFGRDHLFGLIPFFDMSEEKNLPSWYATVQLALAALLLTAIAVRKRAAGDKQWVMWAILALGFWFMSLDETATLHEYWAPNTAPFDLSRGIWTYRWVMVAIPLVAFVGLLFSRFVFSLPKRTRNAIIGSGVLYVGSAVGVEMIQALYHSTYRVKDLGYYVINAVEESGEMVAIAIFIYAMLRYVQDEPAYGRE